MAFARRLLRSLYPLQSGLGTIANASLLKKLDGNPSADLLCAVGEFELLVPQDDYVGRSIKYFGDLDKKITWVVNQTLQPGDTALDIGANLGLVSFKMRARVGKTGRVISFEPQPRMTGYLEKSIAHNGIENLHLQKVGLGDTPGTLRLSIPQGNAGAASFATEGGAHVEDVPVTTLDAVHAEQRLSEVQLIKVDVEGFEPQVFAGGKRFFAEVKPKVVVFEENRKSKDLPDSIQIIQSYGYDVFSLPKSWFAVTLRPLEQDGGDAHDFVAIHQEAPSGLRQKLGV